MIRTESVFGAKSIVDFVNTVSWPGTDRVHDWLDDAANIVRWFEAVALPRPSTTAIDIASVAAVRQTLTDVLRPVAR